MPPCWVVEARDDLEAVASRLVRQRMRMHAMRIERAHVNVQRTPQERPVDDWHVDSMPFVLITILTDHTVDPGGHLLVRGQGGGHQHTCKLARPGEALLMQGSHLWHCAQQSMTGERISLVTSFYCDDPLIYDSSSIRVALQYSDPADVIEQFIDHVAARFMAAVNACCTEECLRVAILEVAKVKKEHAAALGLIPASRRHGNARLDQALDRFSRTVRALEGVEASLPEAGPVALAAAVKSTLASHQHARL